MTGGSEVDILKLTDEINRTHASSTVANLNYLSTPLEVAIQPSPSAPKKENRSELAAFLMMMKSSFFLAWQFLTALAFVFFITFVIFPALITDTKLEFLQGIKNDDLRFSWTMLVFIFSFNIFDTLGRWLAGQKFGALSDSWVMILSYSRVLFIATAFLVDYSVGPSWLFGD